MTTPTTRTEKLDLRLTAAAKQALHAAAAATRRSVSEFVLDSALARAEETLAARRHFGLTAEKWEAFMAALDAEPRKLPRVRKLFKTASVFEGGPLEVSGLRIEKLARHHAVEAFECGQPALTRFLVRFALPSQQSNVATTYVGLADDAVIGFHSLVVGEVRHADAPERLRKGIAHHPVPVMLLARLAVHQGWQGRGVGAGLLKDAMRRTVQAADIAGIRALAVHAKDDNARAFYRRFDFIDAPTDPMHLFLLIKDLRRCIA